MKVSNIALAITGASGSAYGLRLLQVLLRSRCRVQLMVSNPGRMVIAQETGLKLSTRSAEIREALGEHLQVEVDDLVVHGREDWFAPVASGSNPPDAMVVCPCTTGSLGEIAAGTSRSLIERAADVVMKERRTLVLVVRETPLSTIHLENMLRLSRAGVVIMPANPGFYHRPDAVEGLVDYMVARVLDHLRLPHRLMTRWGEDA